MTSAVSLGEVLEIQNGFAFKSAYFSSSGGIPLIRIRDLPNNYTEANYRGKYRDDFLVYPGELLIGMDGEFKCFKWNGPKGLLNQRVCRLQRFSPSVEPDYIFYYIDRRLQQIEQSTSFATVKHISSKQIASIQVPLPPLDEQRRIVDILNRANGIRRLRREALDKARQLVPALFVDMFGDPATNTMGWPVQPLGSVLSNHDNRRVPLKGSDRAKRQGRYPYYGASGIIDHIDDYLFEGRYLLVAEDGANLLARSTPIAFCASGKFWVNNHAHIMGESAYACLDFVECYLNRISLREYITGSAQPKLNQASLNRIPIPLPPLALQDEFVFRVAEIQATIAQQERMAEASDQLVAALMARLFDGAPWMPAALAASPA